MDGGEGLAAQGGISPTPAQAVRYPSVPKSVEVGAVRVLAASVERELNGSNNPRADYPVRGSFRRLRPVVCDDLVRLGSRNDGGYVLPRRLIERSAMILTLGVNDDWSFEEAALGLNPTLRLVFVDGTIRFSKILRRAVVKLLSIIPSALTLQGERVQRYARYMSKPARFWRFFRRHELLPYLVFGTARGAGSITLPALLDRYEPQLPPGGLLLLKCDIEGSEYEVLPTIADRLERLSGLILEVHFLDEGDHWARFHAILDVLLRDFVVAHVHGNNSCGTFAGTGNPLTIELVLMRRSMLDGPATPSSARYPLDQLDQPCKKKLPDLALSFD
jgi:hypothetical protein